MENWIMAKAIALYYYNVAGFEWAKAFQAKLGAAWHPDYLAKQEANFRLGFPAHFGTFDFGNQQRHLALILERYGREASEQWSLHMRLAEGGAL